MKAGTRWSPLGSLAAACARRPWRVVAAALVLLALAFLSLGRVTMSASLEAMLGSRSESAKAFHRVMSEFEAGEALLAIVESPAGSAGGEASGARAGAFADRLVEAVLTDPRTRDRVAWARSRQDPEFARFAAEVVFPTAPFYLGEAGTRELLSRFEPAWLDEQFARNEALLSSPGPAGDALSRNVLRDPLRLFELARERGLLGALGGGPGGEAGESDAMPGGEFDPKAPPPLEMSLDERAVLVRIASRASINDVEAAKELVAGVEAIARELEDEARAEGGGAVSVRLGGPNAISAIAASSIRRDTIVSTVVSVGLLYGLFVLFYRRWVAPILIGLVAGIGMIVGFGVNALSAPTISPLAAAVAALLAGLGVDYGIHFVSHFDALRARGMELEESAAEAAREMALPITTNCFTSIFGFASLWPSQIEMLSDFARLGTAGLIGAWISAFTVLPALLVLTRAGERERQESVSRTGAPKFGVLADAIGQRPSLWRGMTLSLATVLIGAAIVRGEGLKIEGSLSVLHPQPNAALRTTDEVIERFGGQGEMVPILVTAPSPGELLPKAIDASQALLGEEPRRLGVVDVIGVQRLLPDPREATGVSAALGSEDRAALLNNFDAALERSAFEPGAYAGYRGFLARVLGIDSAPGLESLGTFPTIARRLLPRDSWESLDQSTATVLVVRLERPLRTREQRGAVVEGLTRAVAPLGGVTVAGLAAVSTELEDLTRQDLPVSIGISVALVVVWLVLVFRNPVDVVMALVPLVFAGTCTIAFMAAFDIRFNPINSITIPLLDGIAVDAGVFLVSIAREARSEGAGRAGLVERLRPTMHAVLLASATTITGFLSLCATRTPAIRSLGFIAAIGITASFCGAVGVLVPWMLRRARGGAESER